MVVDEINKNGGVNGHQLELIMMDSKSNETEAALAARKLIQQGVAAIIGASTSGTTMAMVDIVQKAEIPLVSCAASIRITEPVEERHWVFKVAQSDSFVAENLVDYLNAKGWSRVALATANNAYGDSGRDEFEKAAAQGGINIIAKEKFEQDDTIMTSQLTKIKQLNPDAVICWAIPPAASTFTTNYRQMDIQAPLLHSSGVGNQSYIELAGEDANGTVFPVGRLLVAEQLPDTDPQKEATTEYVALYEERFGPRSTFGGHAWDAVKVIAQVLEKTGPDPAKIRDELEKTSFVGATAVFNFTPQDHSGLTKDCLVMVEVKDGKWSLVK
jgi:branched-chain amino acid transport system substrate-binding protein